jgi:uncharacterized protein YndB with AHSA1/START domain
MAPIDCHRFAFITVASPDQVWAALTNRELSRHYLFGLDLVSDWIPGSSVELRGPDGISIPGQVLSVERNQKLAFAIEQGLGPCRFISWDLRQCSAGTVVRLTVDEVDGDSEDEAEDTWLPVLSALQSQLEKLLSG